MIFSRLTGSGSVMVVEWDSVEVGLGGIPEGWLWNGYIKPNILGVLIYRNLILFTEDLFALLFHFVMTNDLTASLPLCRM